MIARNAGADFHLISVPDELPATEDALEFDPGTMRELFAIGRELGRSGRGWRSEPPRLDALSRIR